LQDPGSDPIGKRRDKVPMRGGGLAATAVGNDPIVIGVGSGQVGS
jgi:hypothetical protein